MSHLQANASAPFLLYVQGGPGSPFFLTLFIENGPLVVAADNNNVTAREYAWTRNYHLLYIDSPVGTGYSFTNDTRGLATTFDMVANESYNFLQQFFTLFSEYQDNEFYLTGSSFGGQFISAIGYKIHQERGRALMNFKGLSIGAPVVDPKSQLPYDQLFYWHGLIDQNEVNYFCCQQKKFVNAINAGNYLAAYRLRNSLLQSGLTSNILYTNLTGSMNPYNLLLSSKPKSYSYFISYVQKAETRAALHVGKVDFSNGSAVENALANVFMKSSKRWLEVLMDNYRVLLYNGNLDVIVPAPGTENLIDNLNWTGAKAFAKVKKTIWKVDPNDLEVAGYVRHVKDFYFIVVRNGGHLYPADQPRVAFNLITNFIDNKGFEAIKQIELLNLILFKLSL